MGVAVVALTVLEVKVAIELLVLHAMDGTTVVLEEITISLVVIVTSEDGTIELVVLHAIDGITVVLEAISISLVLIIASKDGIVELVVVVSLIDGIILVLVVYIASTVEAVSIECRLNVDNKNYCFTCKRTGSSHYV